MGTLTTFIPTEIRPELWEYFQLSKLIKASLAPHPGSNSVVLTVLVRMGPFFCQYFLTWESIVLPFSFTVTLEC